MAKVKVTIGFVSGFLVITFLYLVVIRVMISTTTRESSRVCSLDYLRQFAAKNGYFPNTTWWKDHTVYRKTLHTSYCQIPTAPLNIRKCLSKHHVRKIAVLGDSNGNYMFHQLGKLISEENCSVGAKEFTRRLFKPRVPNGTYFLGNDSGAMKTHVRSCRDCNAKVTHCTMGKSSILLEYIASEYLLDTEMTTFGRVANSSGEQTLPENASVTSSDMSPTFPRPLSLTTQQFLLKEYFHRGGYPDMIMYFTGSHDKTVTTAAEAELYSSILGSLISLYVPETTTVIVFSRPYEEEWLKPKQWQNVKFEGRGLLRTVQLFNEALAKGLRLEFSQSQPHVYPFFDLYTMGRTMPRKWGSDGIHKKPAWYKAVLTNFFRLLCA